MLIVTGYFHFHLQEHYEWPKPTELENNQENRRLRGEEILGIGKTNEQWSVSRKINYLSAKTKIRIKRKQLGKATNLKRKKERYCTGKTWWTLEKMKMRPGDKTSYLQLELSH